jgi:aspartate kinase
MKVFKFGGASLRDAKGVKNVASIIAAEASKNLLVVVSAMGKTTDMLERILSLAASKQDYRDALDDLKKYHHEIIEGPLSGILHPLSAKLIFTLKILKNRLSLSASVRPGI